MFTAGGRGESARRRELLLVVALCRMVGFTVGGVTISKSSSDFSPASAMRVGVRGCGEEFLEANRPLLSSSRSHSRGVSGLTVISDKSRV